MKKLLIIMLFTNVFFYGYTIETQESRDQVDAELSIYPEKADPHREGLDKEALYDGPIVQSPKKTENHAQKTRQAPIHWSEDREIEPHKGIDQID